MKFSIRTVYGLKAVLVLASRYGEGSLAVSQIAKKENISVPYLEQILNALKKKNFVRSVRGPQGGYILARKPSEISLAELLYGLDEKNFKFIELPKMTEGSADEIGIANILFWKQLKEMIDKGLKEISLKDLIDEARALKKNKSKDIYNFQI